MEAITSTWQNLALYTVAIAWVWYVVWCYKQFVMDRSMVRSSNGSQRFPR